MLRGFSTRGTYYEADKDTGSGGGDIETKPAAKPAPAVPPEDKAKKEEPAAPTFTEAQLNQRIEAAKASGNQAALKEFLALIGAKDVEDAKRIAAEYATLAKSRADAEEAQKTELQRANDAAAKAKADGEAALDRARNIAVNAEITVICAELGARNRDHVAALLARDGITVDLETAKVAGVREAVLALKDNADTSYLFKTAEPEVKADDTKAEDAKDKKPATQQVPPAPTAPNSSANPVVTADQKSFADQQARQFKQGF